MSTRTPHCYHCDLPVPVGSDWTVVIDGTPRAMCCPGCQAVAGTIVNGGLNEFYRYRTEPAERPAVTPQDLNIYALPEVARRYLRPADQGQQQVSLLVSGITCAACVWLVERALQQQIGVRSAQLNFATRRAEVIFDPGVTNLQQILQTIRNVGYAASPYDATRQEQALQAERKRQLQRLGVAGLLGMQIMMLAFAMYFGEHYGMEPLYRAVLRWTSLLLAVPLVLYCAQPFFRKAWRNLSHGHVGMDLPVSLGIGVAFVGSLLATWSGDGPIYYESIAMFVFLLLGARYLEFVASQHANRTLDDLSRAGPAVAVRVAAGGAHQTVVADTLTEGDRVLVKPGETFPADGVIASGTTSVDESLLSGESRPVAKNTGDIVIGGSNNIDSPVEVVVDRVGEQAILSQILRLAERAQAYKPKTAVLADRVAHWFVLAVLILAAGTAAYWWSHAPQRWWEITVAVLVVTCPCALSLATPTALVNAIGALTRSGLVTVNGDAAQNLNRITHIVFDKTGTLTTGQFSIQQINTHAAFTPDQCLRIAAALEKHSNHPIAQAISKRAAGLAVPTVDTVTTVTGAGLAGTVDGRRYCLGHRRWIEQQLPGISVPGSAANNTLVYLADTQKCLATFVLEDPVRTDSAALVKTLRNAGYRLSICSGDRSAVVAQIATQLGIDDFRAAQQPGDKLAYVRELQLSGARVLAIGDGVNDAPVLAAADSAIAVGHGAPLAQQHAELILLSDRLRPIVDALAISKKTMLVIKQNLIWAVAYNLCALPAAMAGWIPPWLAALGMSLSSLLVVANATRLKGYTAPRDPERPQIPEAHASVSTLATQRLA